MTIHLKEFFVKKIKKKKKKTFIKFCELIIYSHIRRVGGPDETLREWVG
jgi:hypothetical protein